MLLRRYVHGPGVDEPLVWYEGSGTANRRWLLADERGSVIAITDGSGTVTQVNKYDVDGVPDAQNNGRFQYTGQMWIAEAGVYSFKARAYHPGLGRFLQTDPSGFAGGLNLYAYAGDDPVNATDPTGLEGETIHVWGTRGDVCALFGCGPEPPPNYLEQLFFPGGDSPGPTQQIPCAAGVSCYVPQQSQDKLCGTVAQIAGSIQNFAADLTNFMYTHVATANYGGDFLYGTGSDQIYYGNGSVSLNWLGQVSLSYATSNSLRGFVYGGMGGRLSSEGMLPSTKG